MDVLFFLFFQATVRCLAVDPTDTEGLRPVLGLLNKPILAPLGCLDCSTVGEKGLFFLGGKSRKMGRNTLFF